MSANDGLKYPKNFQEFMGVVARWQRAREATPTPGEGVGDWLLRTSHELDDAVTIFRQVWERAERPSWREGDTKVNKLHHWWQALWSTYRWTWDAKNGWKYHGRTAGVNACDGGKTNG